MTEVSIGKILSIYNNIYEILDNIITYIPPGISGDRLCLPLPPKFSGYASRPIG